MLKGGQNAQRNEAKMVPDLVSEGYDLRGTCRGQTGGTKKLYMRLRGSA